MSPVQTPEQWFPWDSAGGFWTRDGEPICATNGWSIHGVVHAPSTCNGLVPLCVEADARASGLTPPSPDKDSLNWAAAIPHGDSVNDQRCDCGLVVDCKECIEWMRA